MANYRYLGYGITNNEGVATLDHDSNGNPITHSYTGTGAGEIDIVASLDDNEHISDSSLQSEIYEVTDAKYYDKFSSDTTNRYTINTSQGNSISVSDGKLVFVSGTGSRYVRLQTSRTESTLVLADFLNTTVKFQANVETSVNITCSIVCQTPSGDVQTNGNTISSDGLLEVEASIPSNATNVIFNINTGTNNVTTNISDWIIYFV